jgi:cyclic pyranopterin phosphate synthase
MVDVGSKPETRRIAVAGGTLSMAESTLDLVTTGGLAKGEVLQVARVAGIQAAKRTGELIPLCHPLGLDLVQVHFQRRDATHLEVFAAARLTGRTGVEMEALTAVSVAALTVYDMVKAVDRGMAIGGVRLLFKCGGKTTWCELAGVVAEGRGGAGPDGRVPLFEAPLPDGPGACLVVQGIPFGLLPDDLWLVGEGGLRGRLVPGPALLLDPGARLPAAGARVVVRTGESYGG